MKRKKKKIQSKETVLKDVKEKHELTYEGKTWVYQSFIGTAQCQRKDVTWSTESKQLPPKNVISSKSIF